MTTPLPAQSTEFAELMVRAGLQPRQAAAELGISERTVRRHAKGECQRTDHLRIERLREIANIKGRYNPAAGFRFIDLFAGIGGMRIPFEEIGGRCVFTAEWDRFSKATYQANFTEGPDTDHVWADDIRPWADQPESIPEHDVLVAGFPCQPFSIAGVSKKNALGKPHGFKCTTQGTLFYDLANIIHHHRPAAFLLENVKNLERHNGGKTFGTIMDVLTRELEYNVTYRVISSAPWVPQKRERIFIVGFRDHGINFDFNGLMPPDGDEPTLGSILDSRVDPKFTLSAHLWNYLKAYKERHRRAGNGFGYSLFGPDDVARTLSARYHKDGSEILIRQRGRRPRRLTPHECARLMGFEKPGRYDWQIPVSDTQAYRQFGNAVVVPVVRAVANQMRPGIVEALALEGKTLPDEMRTAPLPMPEPGIAA